MTSSLWISTDGSISGCRTIIDYFYSRMRKISKTFFRNWPCHERVYYGRWGIYGSPFLLIILLLDIDKMSHCICPKDASMYRISIFPYLLIIIFRLEPMKEMHIHHKMQQLPETCGISRHLLINIILQFSLKHFREKHYAHPMVVVLK